MVNVPWDHERDEPMGMSREPKSEAENARCLSDVLMELGTDTGMASDDVFAAMSDHPEFACEILDFALTWYLTPDAASEGENA